MKILVYLKMFFAAILWMMLIIIGILGYTFYKGNLYNYTFSSLIVSMILICLLWLFGFKFSGGRIIKAFIMGIFIVSLFVQYIFFNNPECPQKPPDGVKLVFSKKKCEVLHRTDRDMCNLATANPFDLTTNGKLLFVTHGKNESVTVHKYPIVSTNEYNFGIIRTGLLSRPQRMAIDEKKQNLYITNYGTNNDIIHVDLHNARTEFIDIAGCKSSIDVTIDNKQKRLWILCEGSRTIIVYDLAKNTIIKKLFTREMNLTTGLPYSIAINEKTRKVYVAHWVGTRLLMIDADTFKLTGVKRIGISAFKILVDEDRNLIYIARPLASDVLVVDGADLSDKKRLYFGKGIRDIELIPRHRLLAGGGYVDGIFRVVEVESGKMLAEFKLGTLIRGTFYDDQTETIWIASGCGIYSMPLKTFQH